MSITQFVVFWVVMLASSVAYWKVSSAYLCELYKVGFSSNHNRGIMFSTVAWAALLVLGLLGYLSHAIFGWHWPDWTVAVVIVMVIGEPLIVSVRGDIKHNRAH